MNRIIAVFCALALASGFADAAERGTNVEERPTDAPLESIEMSASLTTRAELEPLDDELYLDVLEQVTEYAQYWGAQGFDISTSQVNQWMYMNKDKFTNRQLMAISDRLSNMDDGTFRSLMFMDEFKDPFVSLMLSIFVGGLGVDRFYIGDIGQGIGKLLTAGGLGIWWLIDIFSIENATKDKNYVKFNEFLAMIR